MTIYPHQTTASLGELTTRRADRPAFEELRRSRAAAPPSQAVRDAQAENLAGAEGGKLPSTEEPSVPETAIRQLAIRKDPEIDRVVVRVLDGNYTVEGFAHPTWAQSAAHLQAVLQQAAGGA